MSLARQLLLLQLAIVLTAVAATATFAIVAARDRAIAEQRARVVASAKTLSESAEVQSALRLPNPSERLQPLAERIRRANGFSFVVFMSPEGTRYSHPQPAEIGRRYVGEIQAAQQGRTLTETATGTLGRSVRAVTPIRDSGGAIVGLIGVGVLETTVSAQVRDQLPALALAVVVALALGIGGSALLARRVRRQTRGLDPDRLAALYDHQEAVLRAIREGVVVVGRDGRVQLVNDEAVRLLDLPADPVGRPIEELVVDPDLRETLAGSSSVADGLHVVGDRVLVAGRRTARRGGQPLATVTTLRDRTELEGLVRELATVRSLVDALRAQTHEAANELHTVVGLVELGRHDDAVAFATRRISVTQDEVDVVHHHIADPAVAALLLAKAASCREQGVHLELAPTSSLPEGVVPAEDLVTILGNLIDNALDAQHGRGGRIMVDVHLQDADLQLTVHDDGSGFSAEALESATRAGWSTKPSADAHGRGLGLSLVNATAQRLGGSLRVSNEAGGGMVHVTVPARTREDATT
ncbi:MAG: GHKL domain-containing protein [Solirubrobacteraceae bacterium]|nr:GHKL domain-containing protein [Solirubrobacteraceae bacterium]